MQENNKHLTNSADNLKMSILLIKDSNGLNENVINNIDDENR